MAGAAERQLSYLEAIAEALDLCLAADERVLIMGEDVSSGGGEDELAAARFRRFGPERIRDTPISEIAIAGAALGAALNGLKPVAEFLFSDLLPIAAQQIINQIGPYAYLSNGQRPVHLVLRIPVYGFPGNDHTHSKTPWGLFLQTPGLKIVAPATPYDAKGMLIAAIEDPNPVLFFEHRKLYSQRGGVPGGRYTAPLAGAVVRRPGTQVSIVALSSMLGHALHAAQDLSAAGISAEVIDLRALAPLKIGVIVESVRKTGRLLVVDEAPAAGGIAAEVVAAVCESTALAAFKAPPMRLCPPLVPSPYSNVLKEPLRILPANIVRAAKALVS